MVAVESEGLLDILEHPNKTKYPNQKILVVSFDAYEQEILAAFDIASVLHKFVSGRLVEKVVPATDRPAQVARRQSAI